MNAKTNKIIKGIVLLAIAAGVISLLIFLPVKEYLVALLEWTKSLGAVGPIVVAAAYVVACVLFVPGSILTIGAGFLFGVGIGALTVSIGSTLGAAAAFLVGRTLARKWIADKVTGNKKFAAIDEAVGKEGFKLVLLLRLSPIFPFNLLNYALGLTRVSFWKYFFASWLGMLPATIMYVYFGSAARSLTDIAAGNLQGGAGQQVFFWIGLAATIVVAVFVTKIASKSLKAVQES
jgi:uncharacterized membrane protein YdjX (TVP38/TMEM64 family)